MEWLTNSAKNIEDVQKNLRTFCTLAFQLLSMWKRMTFEEDMTFTTNGPQTIGFPSHRHLPAKMWCVGILFDNLLERVCESEYFVRVRSSTRCVS